MKRAYGFTIVELVVVIAVIGILASITVVAYRSYQTDARDTAIKAAVTQLSDAMKLRASQKNESLNIAGTGYNGTGFGWIQSRVYGSSDVNLVGTLINEGYLPPGFAENLKSRNVGSDNRILMLYRCSNGRFALYASLNDTSKLSENRALSDANGCTAAPFTSYGCNYVKIF